MTDPDGLKLLTHLNSIDYGIIGIITLSVLISVIRGFVREALSLITWITAIGAAVMFTSQGADWLVGRVDSQSLRLMISFAVIFLGVLLLGSLFSYVIGLAVKKTGLSGADRLIGLAFGLLRGMLIVTVAIIGIGFSSFSQQTLWTSSALIPQFETMTQWGITLLPTLIGKNVESME